MLLWSFLFHLTFKNFEELSSGLVLPPTYPPPHPFLTLSHSTPTAQEGVAHDRCIILTLVKEVSTGSASPVTWPSRWITARKLRHKAYVRRQRSLQRKTKANIESFVLNPGKHKLSDVTVMMLLRVHNQCLFSQVLFCILS